MDSVILLRAVKIDTVNPKAQGFSDFGAVDKLDQIITTLARVEEKLDQHTITLKEHDDDLESLKKKWWSGVGAFFLAVGLWLKQLVS